MSDACIVAFGAVSAFGVGAAATFAGAVGEAARVAITTDAALTAAGLTKPFAARAPNDLGEAKAIDRATDLLTSALTQLSAALDASRPGWRRERIGVALATSSGGMVTAERLFAGETSDDVVRGAPYFAPFDAALAAVGLGAIEPRTQVLAACAASTIAMGIGLRWLDHDACDLVIAGGYDGVSVFVAAGFEVLRATSATRPAPFRSGRDGMALGEGAGVVALVREQDTRGAAVLGRIAGFGASNDAVHITAPDRTGSGLARAGAAALADAGVSAARVDLVSGHATATPYNDAMEARAIASLLGARLPAMHPFKAQIGHTLGAAGVLETLAIAAAMRAGVAPAAAGSGALDPDAPALLLDRAEPRVIDAALKLSAAFGGTNASLVLTSAPSGRVARRRRPVYLRGFARTNAVELVDLANHTGVARDRLARLDVLCRLGLDAVTRLAAIVGPLDGAGIVAGHAFATLETHRRFTARIRARGPAAAEPRVFPSTSPNAIVGECAIVHHLTGPSFAVGAGLDGGTEALRAALDLVAGGDAERMVVVAADEAGPTSAAFLALAENRDRRFEEGAIALLLTSSPDGIDREIAGKITPDHARTTIGHLALGDWVVGV